ncbi:MAG: hypothetical protein MJ107_02940 [Lachnospiraceae bacterium]|nr:hypothetical protein [Lachnospiraceae bacterium]
MFKTTNETDKFRYDDCVIKKMIIDEVGISLSVDALIVKADNSQNSNYTESYADTAEVEIKAGKIVNIIRDGYKVFDANDVLLREVPDEEVDINSKKWNVLFEGQYLVGINRTDEKKIVIIVELMDEESMGVSDSYSVSIECESVDIKWERYLNRVSAY